MGGRKDKETLGSTVFNPSNIVQGSHAELCPVCHGEGKIKQYKFARGQTTSSYDLYWEKTCHGCGGKGWVIVATVYGVR